MHLMSRVALARSCACLRGDLSSAGPEPEIVTSPDPETSIVFGSACLLVRSSTAMLGCGTGRRVVKPTHRRRWFFQTLSEASKRQAGVPEKAAEHTLACKATCVVLSCDRVTLMGIMGRMLFLCRCPMRHMQRQDVNNACRAVKTARAHALPAMRNLASSISIQSHSVELACSVTPALLVFDEVHGANV